MQGEFFLSSIRTCVAPLPALLFCEHKSQEHATMDEFRRYLSGVCASAHAWGIGVEIGAAMRHDTAPYSLADAPVVCTHSHDHAVLTLFLLLWFYRQISNV
jgi:hypothetical protein